MRSPGCVLALCFAATICRGQNAPTPQASDPQKPADQTTSAPAPAALPTPSITGPLAVPPPAKFDAGPFGTLNVNGIVSGLGMWNGNYVRGDSSTQAALSNGQVWIQKTDGWF